MRRKKDKSNGITALYERLSRDDDNAGESNSIVHQKQMLEDYAMKHGFTNLVHFTDDGWSGATFDRPSWNRLVEGVKNGEITACICKDMSRIGRDHLQVGFFTDILFREKEVRFIAINNGIDSDRQETSEFAPFLNIMNEWFVRDTSKKIKAVLKSRGSSGNAHTSNIPPYGYLKDPENPDHWIIDEEAAEVVRRIYRMTIEGKGPYQIARELSEEKIERPSYYLGKKGLGNHASNYDKENPYMWRGNQVTTLIARPEYIGKTVNFRTFKNSYKDKKTKRADKEDWVVFDDTQEPIVDEETWLLAQKLRQNVRKADPMGEPNVLTGKIYCADCGAPMYNHRQRKGRERIYYTAKGEKRTSYSNPADCYECSTYNLAYQKYDRHCTCHHISTKALKSIILKTIQETCHYVSLNEREFVYSLQEESAMKDIAVSETVKNRIERNQKRVHELDMLIRKIYEDNVIGRLPDRLFQSMLTDYENEQNELNKIIETDTADMQRIIGGQNNVERFLKLVKKYENITEVILQLFSKGCNYMKKVLLLSSVIIILGLTGCSNKYFNDWFSSEQNETDKMCQQIIEACKQQDSEKLKSLFSEESKKNIENLDTEISAFFDYIEGSIQRFEGDCASSSESNYGKRKTELDGMYLILTEKERYCMNFYMYSQDDENAQNVGIYKIEIALESEVAEDNFIWDNPPNGIFVGGQN